MYKLVALLPTPIYCIVIALVSAHVIRKIVIDYRKRRFSQMPLYSSLIFCGLVSIALKIILDLHPELAYSPIVVIPAVVMLVMVIAATVVSMVLGDKRNEFNAEELEQLRKLKIWAIIAVPLILLIALLIAVTR